MQGMSSKERSIGMLGMVFTAMADLVDDLGQVDQAIGFEETAQRYSYLFGDPQVIHISHHNLANYLKRGSRVCPRS